MKAHRVLLTLLAACTTVCVMAPSVAQAQVNPCTVADFALLGERAHYDSLAAGAAIYLKTPVTAGRSYTVMAWGPFGGGPLGEDDIVLSVDLFTDNTCTTAATTVSTTQFEPLLSILGHTGKQVSIVPTATGPLYVRVQNDATTTALTVHALVIETTLFSPWWFTGGTNQAYIEVRNSMVGATTAQITLYKPDGTVCGTTSVPIAGNGNAAVSINTVGTCAAALSGSAQIAFAGTPGGMTANITTIDVPNGTSFDSPFVPRMVWSTFSR
jgi:hypothetical protein